jgi:biopolymer transport protein ExbD
MKFKRQRRFEAEVATASLNDIMFFLMLFFLIVSTLGSPNVIKLLLPKSDKSTHDVSKEPLTLSINDKREYFIDKKPVDFAELESSLVSLTAGKEEPTVLIRADQTLTIQDLVDVMAIGARIKVRMVLGTELSKK